MPRREDDWYGLPYRKHGYPYHETRFREKGQVMVTGSDVHASWLIS